ncbi:RT0821/Lpp0805 family surface protein [Maricaulis sp.]|jgi:hypothetical protein|uniref:RT0821/Lpp0805 family surface protein n=1 Tax=Maricaulis sp. TaxID=1486257 RepID=UPI002606751C|nr:RT0821/Lpp0805 family surface protein [Maricaulis sp.]
MTCFKTIIPALGAFAVLAGGAAAQHYHHQSSARFEYHSSYYERGYHAHDFRYYRGACRTRSSGGLGLGLSLGGGEILSANIGGHSWTECDRGQFVYAQYDAFDHNRPTYWHNPDTGRRGVIRPDRRYHSHGRECASAHAEVYDRDGDYQSFGFESCRDGSGRWHYEGRTGY